MYSIKGVHKTLDKATAKGIPKRVREKNLLHNKYLDALYMDTNDRVEITTFKSKNHKVFTVNQHKRALSNYNDKVLMLKDSEQQVYTPHSYGYNPNK